MASNHEAKVLKLAKVLRVAFDMRFGSHRQWNDLPPEMRDEYVEIARDVIRDMCDPDWDHDAPQRRMCADCGKRPADILGDLCPKCDGIRDGGP